MVSFKSTLFAALAVFIVTESQLFWVVAAAEEAKGAEGNQEAKGAAADNKEDAEAKKRNEDAKKADKAIMDAIYQNLTKVGANVADVADHVAGKSLDKVEDKDWVKDHKEKMTKEKDALDKLLKELKDAKDHVPKEGEDKAAPRAFKDVVADIPAILENLKGLADEAYEKAKKDCKKDDKDAFKHDIRKTKARFVGERLDGVEKVVAALRTELGDEIKKEADAFKEVRLEVNKLKIEVNKGHDEEGVDSKKNFQKFRDEAHKAAEKANEVIDAAVKFRNDKSVEHDEGLLNNLKELILAAVDTSNAYIPTLALSLLTSVLLF